MFLWEIRDLEVSMDILFVSACEDFNDTSAAIRNREVVKGLGKFAYITSVEFSVSEDGRNRTAFSADKKVRINYRKQSGEKSLIKSAGLVKNTKIYLFRLFKQLGKFVFPDALSVHCMIKGLEGFEEENHYDYVILNSDPKGIYFLLFNMKFRKFLASNPRTKLVTVWGDPWYLDVHGRQSRFIWFLERTIIKRASFITYNTMGTLEAQKRLHPKFKAKMLFLPRTLDLSLFSNLNLPSLKNNINVLYAGDYRNASRNITPIYDALNGREGVTLTICGDGDVDLFSTSNVTIRGRQSKEVVDNLVSACDFLVVLLNIKGTQLPGKLYDYAITDKPVLVLYENECDTLKLPFPSRFIFLKNDSLEILKFFENFEINCILSEPDFLNEMKFYETSFVLNRIFREMGEEMIAVAR